MSKIFWSFILSCALGGAAQAQINIVATIEPLALISQAIVGEQGQTRTLVDAQQSPHDYAIRPSDRIAIQQADLLIWVDPAFEMYLADVFVAQGRNKPLISFSALQGVTLATEASGELDPHLWLDSQNALALAAEIANQVSALDAANSAFYAANLDAFREEILLVEQEIALMFVRETRKPYAVYHNAYRYFETQYSLQHALVLLQNPESQPGVQEIINIRRRVQETQLACLFVETDSNQAIIDTMLSGALVPQTVVDVLGYQTRAGYVGLLRNLAAQFRECIY